VIYSLAICPATNAGAILGLLSTVRLNMGDYAVANMNPENTRATTMAIAGGGDYFDFPLFLCWFHSLE
jgi:hypothetical protein